MAVKKVNSYGNFDLYWLETKVTELRKYVDDNPIDDLTDRTDLRQMPNGGTLNVVVASVETQIKSIRDSLKDFTEMVEVIGKKRERDAIENNIDQGNGCGFYITDELGWLEYQVANLKQYVDKNPQNKLVDRKVQRISGRGHTYEIQAATIEAQITSIRQTLKDIVILENHFNMLQKVEDTRKKLRGKSTMNLLMQNQLSNK